MPLKSVEEAVRLCGNWSPSDDMEWINPVLFVSVVLAVSGPAEVLMLF